MSKEINNDEAFLTLKMVLLYLREYDAAPNVEDFRPFIFSSSYQGASPIHSAEAKPKVVATLERALDEVAVEFPSS